MESLIWFFPRLNGEGEEKEEAVPGGEGGCTSALKGVRGLVLQEAVEMLPMIPQGMSQLRLEDDGPKASGYGNQYPDHSGQPDCTNYLRTGICAYGSKCCYNHPTHIGQGTQYTGKLSQREG